MRKAWVLLGFLLLSGQLWAQCPNPSLTLPANLCAGSDLNLSNPAPGAASYEWDFCPGDLMQSPSITSLGVLSGNLSNPRTISLVNDGTNWFGFIKNSNNTISRLEFGSSLTNVPTDTNLGNPGGLFSSSFGKMAFHKENGNWYAFSTSVGGNRLVRVDFGPTLNGGFTPTDLGNVSGLLSGPRDVQIVTAGDTIFSFIANFSNNKIIVHRQLNSILNPADTVFQLDIPVSTSAGLYSVKFVRDCEEWVAFGCNQSSWDIYRLHYGSSLFNSVNFTNFGFFSGGIVNNPRRIEVEQEDGRWLVFIRNINSGIGRIDLGDDILGSPQASSLSNFGGALNGTESLDIQREGSRWYAFASRSNDTIYRIEFPEVCQASPSYSTSPTPQVSFTGTGFRYMTLTVTDTNGAFTMIRDSISVDAIPQSAFSSGLACEERSTQFTDQSLPGTTSITNWLWYFGDGDSSLQANPSHVYTVAGNYQVTLVVTNDVGCTDTMVIPTTINPIPLAGFIAPNGCAGAPLAVVDTSTVVNDVITQWEWDLGNGDTVFGNPPAISYDSAGSYQIILTATTSNGCSDTVQHFTQILPSPIISFSLSNTCAGNQTQFQGNTFIPAPATITAQGWNFGDSTTSSSFNPIHQYQDTGNYLVTLSALADNGCADSVQQLVRISQKPSPAFTTAGGPVCENNFTTLVDQSTVMGDTISGWVWDFGTGDSAFVQNPSYAFPSGGSFNVTLIATAGTDCDSSITAPLTVLNGPQAMLDLDGNCFGTPTQFSDSSLAVGGDPINNWVWTFGDNTVGALQHPSKNYPSAGTYAISLEVTSDSGCVDTAFDTISIFDPPILDLTISTACSDLETTFSDLSTPGAGDSVSNWDWIFENLAVGTTITDSAQNPLVVFDTALTYLVNLTITTDEGCTADTLFPLDVIQSPIVDFSVSTECEGTPTQITDATIGTNIIWFWELGNGINSSLRNPSILFDTVGLFPISVEVVDLTTGCTDTMSGTAQVYANPEANFFADDICIGSPTQFSDSSLVVGDFISSYEWQVFGGDSSLIRNPQFIFDVVGPYSVSLKVTTTQGGCQDSVSKVVEAHPLPTAGFNFSPLFGVPPLVVDFTNSSTGATNYMWDFGDFGLSTEFEPTHVFVDTGEYDIKLTAISEFGCLDSLTTPIKVIQPVLDIALIALRTEQNGDLYSLSVDLQNLGTRDIFNFDLVAELPDGTRIRESWAGILRSGESIKYDFNASFELRAGVIPQFTCVRAVDPNGEEDDVPSNNNQCEVNVSGFLALEPYPNPTTDQITMVFFLPDEEEIDIWVFDQLGHEVLFVYSGEAPAGRTELKVPVTGLASGIYNVVFQVRDRTTIRRFVKAN